MNTTVEETLRGFALEASAKAQELEDAIAFARSELPDEYLDVMRFSNGASGWLRGRYLIIYSVSEVIAVNRAADSASRVPGKLIFGSNGGGTSYLIDLGTS